MMTISKYEEVSCAFDMTGNSQTLSYLIQACVSQPSATKKRWFCGTDILWLAIWKDLTENVSDSWVLCAM